MTGCKADGCTRGADTRGLCYVHYSRWHDGRVVSVGDRPLEPWELLPDDPIFCECPEPEPKDGPLTWGAVAHGPLPCECLRCGLPVWEAVVGALAS